MRESRLVTAAGALLRPATLADAQAAASVQLQAALTGYAGIFPSSAPQPTLEALHSEWVHALRAEGTMAWVAHNHDAVVGVVLIRADPGFPGYGQLRRLYVTPAHWREGVGSMLHDVALVGLRDKGFDRASLWVLERNVRARAMYERRGWSLDPGCRLDRPGSGVTEVRYVRALR